MKKKELKNLLPLIDATTIATEGMKDGRGIAILVVNGEEHDNFISSMNLHRTTKDLGDMVFTWAWPKSRFSKSMVYINIDLIKPIKYSVCIGLDPVIYGEVIDTILLSKMVTIIHGKEDIVSLIKNEAPSISVDVPDGSTFPCWNKMYLNALTKRYKKQGFKRKRAIELAKQQVSAYRKRWITKDYESCDYIEF